MKNSSGLLQQSLLNSLADVQLVATDMDGTLTKQGRFTPELMRSLDQLASSGIPVLIVTGRSAGWVQAIAHYLPIAGAIAENGGIYIPADTGEPVELVDLPDLTAHRQALADMFAQLRTLHPALQPSSDNPFRLTDWTFDIGNLTPDALTTLAQTCDKRGWGFTYSTVQCHIRPRAQDKGVALRQVLQMTFPSLSPEQVVTVGDSPNDEGLFDAEQFPLSVGVANVQHYRDRLRHFPAFVLQHPEVDGFRELADVILNTSSG